VDATYLADTASAGRVETPTGSNFFRRINAFARNIDPGGKLRSCGEMELKTSPCFALLLP
jgi:hypothetical protein